jgi:hypothetical protein
MVKKHGVGQLSIVSPQSRHPPPPHPQIKGGVLSNQQCPPLLYPVPRSGGSYALAASDMKRVPFFYYTLCVRIRTLLFTEFRLYESHHNKLCYNRSVFLCFTGILIIISLTGQCHEMGILFKV